jgi:hypothetical protein
MALYKGHETDMRRREQWRKVLDREVGRWSVLPYGELLSALATQQVYCVGFESKEYQVELEILESTSGYIHLMISVDDGSLPASILPVTHSFIRNKPPAG